MKNKPPQEVKRPTAVLLIFPNYLFRTDFI
jgi:hypothetical protein